MNITNKLFLTCLIVFLFTLQCELQGIFEDRNDINLPGKVIYEGEGNIEYPRILNSDSILFSESKYGELGCYSTEVKILSLKSKEIKVIYKYRTDPGPADYKNGLLLVSPGWRHISLINNDKKIFDFKGYGASFNEDGNEIVYEKDTNVPFERPLYIYRIQDSTEIPLNQEGLFPEWDKNYVYYQWGGKVSILYKIYKLNILTGMLDTVNNVPSSMFPRASNEYITFLREEKTESGYYNWYTIIQKDSIEIKRIKDAYDPDICNDKIVFCNENRLFLYKYR